MSMRETWGLTLVLLILAFGAIGFAIGELSCMFVPVKDSGK